MVDSPKTCEVMRRVAVTDSPAELAFLLFRWFRTAKVQRRGEIVEHVIDADGRSHPFLARHEWREVCPGVTARKESVEYRLSGGKARIEETVFVRVQQSACPLRIVILQIDETQSEHYTRYGTERGAVLVEGVQVSE